LLPIAIPVGLMNVMGPLATAIVTTLLATSGAAAVAAYGIVGRIEAISAVVLMAVSIGMSPLVGQNYGAKKYDRVAETLHTALKFCIWWSILTGAFLMVMGRTLAEEFSTDPNTVTIVATYFLIMGISRALPNIVVGWGSLWYAMGKPKFGVINNLSILGMGTILPALIGHALGGWYGLFLAMMMGQIITGLALHFWSAQQFKNLLGRF
jgi:Na+-driven multidrug efflux pump